MNKVYKHIWSETLGQMVVVSECAKGAKGKKKNTLASTLIAGTALLGAPAFADSPLPSGGEIVSGAGSIDQSGNAMTVTQSSQRMITNWQDFSIDANASVTFHQPGADAVALNRVMGSDPSQILGNLNANGQVFLINPNGVVFGQGAQVQTGGFVASTLEMTDEDFLAGNYHFTGNGGEILNLGDLSGAVVALIAPSVINEGNITGDTLSDSATGVALAAGTDVLLDFDGDGLISVEVKASTLETLVDNRGLIRADGGTAILTAKGASDVLKGMVNNSGTVQARTLENRNGRILLLGDMENSVVNAAGSLEADFVETSAATVNLDADLKVDTHGGEWLIDPTDMIIDDATAIETGLAGGNVTISTAGAGSDEGNIVINDKIDWSANILTLTADNNITINAELTSTGTTTSDGLILNYAQTTSSGEYIINAPVNLAAGSLFQTNNNGTVTTYTIITELGTESSSADGTLQGIAGELDGNYVLGADIDAAATAGWNGGTGFSPIGDIDTLFAGRFEGAGHDISHLTINRPGSDFVGLFGAIDLNVGAVVQHLDLNNVDIVGRDYVGALAGANGGVLRYVSSTGRVEGRDVVGGLIGLNKGSPSRSWSEAEAFGNRDVGGLIGQNHTLVEQVYASGTVNGNENVGGLVGYNQGGGTIRDSYALGAVNGTLYVGGFAGLASGTITRSYASGAVNGGEDIPDSGPFIGEGLGGNFTHNYHDKETALVFGGISYSSPNLTSEALREERYGSDWDFDNTWFMIDGQTRPFLRFEWSAHISNAHQLQLMAMDLTADYTLAGDIDLGPALNNQSQMWGVGGVGITENGFSPIGTSFVDGFSGSFDGGGHTIANLSIQRGNTDNVGLFAWIYNTGVVRNLHLENADILGHDYVGALVGRNWGTLSHITLDGQVVGNDWVGGMLGGNRGELNRSWSRAGVSGNDYTGGMVGVNESSSSLVEQVYAAGPVDGGRYVGGMAGYNLGTIRDAYSLGAVDGEQNVGGFVGYNTGSLSRNYSTGLVNGGVWVQGLGIDGFSGGGSVDLTNFSDRESAMMGGAGTSLDTYRAITQDTYTDFDFDNVWFMVDGETRPFLRFEWSTEITNAHQLQLMAMDLSADYTLANDIDLGAALNHRSEMWAHVGRRWVDEGGFSPIGNTSERFLGSFDGQGHVISGLTIDRKESNRVGLFGVVGETGLVQNVGLESGSVEGLAWVGPLVGENYGTVENAYARVDVAGHSIIGGLVGQNSFGGVIGNTYAAGAVTAEGTAIGGLVGYDNGAIIASYYDTQASGQSDEGKGLGLSTEEIKNPLNAIEAGWDFENIWGASDDGANDGYLVLRGGGRSVYDYYIRLSADGEMSKIYGEENPDLASVSATGLGAEHVSFDWDGAINAGTDAGNYHFADALDLSFARGLAGDYYIDYYADASHVNSLTINKAQLSVTALDAGHVYNGQGYSGGNGFSVDGFVNGDTEAVIDDTGLAWGGDAQGAVNVGSYALSLSGLGAANYEFNYNPGALLIDPAALTVTANDAGKTYDAGAWNGGNGISYSGFVNGEDASVLNGSLNYGGSAQGAVNAGEYLLTASGLTSANYDISFVDGTLTIDKTPLTVTANSATVTYNGSEQRVGGFTASGFVGGEDESVLDGITTTGGSGTNAGTYTHTADGSDENYELSFVAGSMTINKALATVTANSATTTYNGSEQSVRGFSVSGLVGDEDESVLGDVTTNGGAGTNAGAYVHIASGSDENYQLTFVDGALAIDPAVITAVTGITAQDKVFNNRNDVVLDLTTAQSTGMIEGDNLSLASASGRFADVNAGDDKLVNISSLVLGGNELGNYVLGTTTSTTTANISKKPASFIANGVTTYTGEIAQPDWLTWVFDPVIGDDNFTLKGELVIGGEAATAIDAGVYEVLPSGLSLQNYELTFLPGELHILPRPISVGSDGITAEGKTYDGTTLANLNLDNLELIQLPGLGGKDGLIEGDNVSFSGAGHFADANAGTGKNVTVTTDDLVLSGADAHNYYVHGFVGDEAVSEELVLSADIHKAPLTVTANDIGKTYDGQTFAGGYSVSYSGFVNNESASVLTGELAFGGEAIGAVDAGSYDLTAGGLDAGNYAIAYENGTLTIDRAPVTLSSIGAHDKIYDGTRASNLDLEQALFDGLFGDDELNLVSAIGTFENKNAGIGKTVTISGLTLGGADANNYTLANDSLTATADIERATITAVTGITAADKTYDGTTATVLDISGIGFSGMIAGDDLGIANATGVFGDKNAGTNKTVTISGLALVGADASNYQLAGDTAVATADIHKATLTVTAGNARKTYDGLAFAGAAGVSYSGFVNGESESVLTGSLVYGGSSQGAVDAGDYTISAFGLGSDNYAITYTDGALTVDKAALTVTANDSQKIYDGQVFSGGNGVSYAGFVNGETAAVLDGDLAYGGDSQGAVNAGSYTISASGLSANNYDITYRDGTLTVDRAALSVTANNAAKIYDGLAFSGGNGVSYSGFVNNETESVLAGDLVYGGSGQGAVNAGSYSLSASGLVSGNYDITYVDGALAVDKAALTVTANNSRKVYDGQAFSGGDGARYSGFVNSETEAVLDGDLVYGGDSQDAVDAGSYTISVSGLGSGNYAIAYADGTLTVDRATIAAITGIAARDKVYDGTTAATLNTNEAAFTGMVAGDALTVATATGAFADKNAGTGKAVTISGLALGGADAHNYTLASDVANTTADINRATLSSVTGIVAGDKTYDGTTSATLDTSGAAFSGMVAGDELTVATAAGVFEDGNAGAGKVVLVSGLALAGADAGNYTLDSTSAVTSADIHKAALAVTVNDDSKTYDGQSYTGGNGITYSGFVAGEGESDLSGELAFSGTSQGAVNAGSYTIEASGLASGNYDITYTDGTLTVSRAALTLSAADVRKTYDGTTTANGSAVVVAGELFGSDSLDGGSFAFADKNAGSGKTVTVSDIAIDDGNNGGNYTVTYADNTNSTIDRATITAVTGITAADKTYDGTTTAVLDISGAGLTGMVAGDDLGIANASGAFGDKNAGTNKTVTISGLALTGADADNYLLASTSTATTADIHRAALAVTVKDDGKTYNGQAYTSGNGIRYSGFVAGEDEGDLSGELAFGGTSQGAVNAGSYTIAASGLSSGNYDITYTDGTLTVDRAALTVSTADVRKTYDGTTTADGSAVVVAGELFGSDSLSGGSFAFADKNAGSGKTVTVSDIAIDDGNNGSNYAVTYVNNTSSTIDRATISAVTGVTAMDKLYNGSNSADLDTGNARFNGMVAGDDLAVATATASFDDPAPGLDKNVSITGIALGGADAGNYVLVDTTAEASATITDSRIAPLLPEQIAPAGIAETDRTGAEELADNRELLAIPAKTESYIAECGQESWRDCNY